MKNAEQIILQYPDLVIQNPEQHKGKWREVFGNENPLHLEVGMGKGQFIRDMAIKYPDINFIGVEVVPSVLVKAIRKIEPEALPNVKLLCVHAEQLANIFAEGEVDQLYLNFSDPWPKKRHEKRRLTYQTFLMVFKQILRPNGEIHLKTDNQGFFEYSLVSMTRFGMELLDVSLNLHKRLDQSNVMTEYEERFARLGHPIYYLVARFADRADNCAHLERVLSQKPPVQSVD